MWYACTLKSSILIQTFKLFQTRIIYINFRVIILLVDLNYFIFWRIYSCLSPSYSPVFEKSMAEDFKTSSVVIFYSVSFISMQ